MDSNDRSRAWIARSDELAQHVVALYVLAAPESTSHLGLAQADAATTDLSEGWRERIREKARAAVTALEEAGGAESDRRVREDIAILLDACNRITGAIDVEEAHLVDFVDVARIAFVGIRVLLDEQNPQERRARALARLRRYAGLDSVAPLAVDAERETRARLGRNGLAMPYEVQLRTGLALGPVLADGIAQLFRGAGIPGWEEAYEAFRAQLDDYHRFVERELLPHARTDHRLPREVYAFALRDAGVDVAPEELAARAHEAFDALVAEMHALAPRVAAAKGLTATDYRDVIHELKRAQLTGDAEAIVDFYVRRLAEIEEICRREDLVTLPHRPARIRVATLAESAEMPAAHMNPPPLVNNSGQVGEFVLPLDVPPAPGGGPAERSDDFTHDAVTWTVVAHEARPGHELQFDRMVENGISLARGAFAFNSVNVEGWALYTEAIVLPYMPLEGQLCSLMMRLHRAARAFLDPELQSGARTPADVQAFLEREIVFSPTFARSEVERYTFRAPGQATSYFYGYSKLSALRAEVETALGTGFRARPFHDFIVDQGLLPPDALRAAVLERFVPAASPS